MIKLVRVDHRLLHGQVAFTWVKMIGTDCILIANDGVAKDSLRMSALRMAKPDNTKMVIKSLEDSINAINSGATDKYNLFIICESIKDAYELAKNVSSIKKINLGGTKAAEGRKQISKAMFVSEEDCQMLRELDSKGLSLEVQMVPDDIAENVMKLI